MAVSTWLYGSFNRALYTAQHDFVNDTYKGMLVGAGYTPNQDSHAYKIDINNEVTSSGYVAGGQEISVGAMSYTGAGNLESIPAGNMVWPSVSFIARYLIVYNDSWPSEATKPLVLCVDFGANITVADQTFYYNWPSGIMLKGSVPAA